MAAQVQHVISPQQPGVVVTAEVPAPYGHLTATKVVMTEGNYPQQQEEEQRKHQAEERARKHTVSYAVGEIAAAIRRTPALLDKSTAAGVELAGLAWEQPKRTLALAKDLLSTTQEAAVTAWKQRGTVGTAAGHAQQAVGEVQAAVSKSPDRAAAAIQEGTAAAVDLVEGVAGAHPAKLGEAAKEGAKGTRDTTSVAATAPAEATAAVKEVALGTAAVGVVALQEPLKTVQAAWRTTKATTQAALMAVTSPDETKAAATQLGSAAQELGSAVGTLAGAASNMPGGKLVRVGVVLMFLPWVMLATTAGIVLGLVQGLVTIGLDAFVRWGATAKGHAAHAVLWRVSTAMGPHQHRQAATQQPTTGVVAALSTTGNFTQRVLSRLAFWQQWGQGAHRIALQTPADGPLLPLLAMGMPGTRYALPHWGHALQPPPMPPTTPVSSNTEQQEGDVPSVFTRNGMQAWLHTFIAIPKTGVRLLQEIATAIYYAITDSISVVWEAGKSSGAKDTFGNRSQRVFALLVQPPILAVAVAAAAVDTLVWAGRQAAQSRAPLHD